ncbi:MAG: cobyric acid synthase [Osedax symbiont Rs1]|nr:MAG: cobyric acid synthase [Osedax symbiont Rs1]
MTVFKNPHSLMVQGTTSDAGKSVIVTALCRILARKGISVAPFKSQNMALNSAVTKEGGEIGRAQAVQAQGANLSPSILMNPVLLKPNSDIGSQVIVNGQSIGNMQAREYHQFKPQLLKTVLKTYRKLQALHPVIIIEGAGSPAEINLREHDIANMGLAEAIDCPVVIVADIDRGGVFAHLYGTFALLSATEQQRVQGFIINRFRGDVSLLQPGLDWLEKKTGVPTIAVIPYLTNLHIESEDAVAQVQVNSSKSKQIAPFKVVVALYPRASNHTDFDVLRLHPEIDCEFLRDSQLFQGADLIILPGSKNVSGDLRWLMETGWQPIIERHLRFGGKVLGICGGYQMLGTVVHDPQEVESTAGSSAALKLLDIETTLKAVKTLTNVEGHCLYTGKAVRGYEIHAGISTGDALQRPWFSLIKTAKKSDLAAASLEPAAPIRYVDGARNAEDNIRGTYLHGLLEDAEMRNSILNWAGMQQVTSFDYQQFREAQIERLADAVAESLPFQQLADLLALASLKLVSPVAGEKLGEASQHVV